ncbi:Cyt-b5 domain-containing protein [Rhizoctonia solani AG-1 IA]|uniref:Cyt-b5 domain-containing protein n=1 Tax=Thanatephorus cucumeris (strain AG1-IA) TaxID=983506 RepID=L8WX41_THACA|nr:Cyt-b5 domain-containing protein [Rhizoctonia solani AG-1 IA]
MSFGGLAASLQEHPINVVLLGIISYQLSSLFRSSSASSQSQGDVPSSYNESYNWKPAKHPSCTVWKKYTPVSLQPFSGRDGGQILLAIDGKVFDVTNGRNFYGPGIVHVRLTRSRSKYIDRWYVRKLCWARCISRHGQAVL